ncbi:MAG: histidine kinase, partial [Saprospiraceae bacterium]|nr:histidine kinase [Saprospiraceae bacterium]
NEFVTFKERPGDSTSIGGYYMLGLVEDSLGNIWVGSESCLNRYEYQTGNFSQFFTKDSLGESVKSEHLPFYASDSLLWYINDSEGILTLNIYSGEKKIIDAEEIYKRNNYLINSVRCYQGKHIWIRKTRGVLRIDLENHQKTHFLNGSDAPSRIVHCLDLDPDGNAWAISTNELFILSAATGGYQHFPLKNVYKSDPLEIKIYEDRTFWIGSSNEGLFLCNTKGEVLDQFDMEQPEKRRLPSNTASNMFIDSEGIIWGSSDPHGVFALVPEIKPFRKVTQYNLDKQVINSKGIKCFAERADGMILLGTHSHKIMQYDPRSKKVFYSPYSDVFPSTEVSSMHLGSDEALWLGSYHGLYRMEKKQKTSINISSKVRPEFGSESNVIWSIVEDSQGNIYYTTDAGAYVWNSMTNAVSLLPVFEKNSCGFLFIDSKNRLYVPKHQEGFARFSLDDFWQNRTTTNPSVDIEYFFQGQLNVKAMHEDVLTQVLWIASSNGVYKTDLSTEDLPVLKYYGQAEGLPSNYVYGILPDEEGFLWFSCNKGIGKIDKETNKIISYLESDGLQGLEFNTNAFLKSSDGLMYFGGVNGFNYFAPKEIQDDRTAPDAPLFSKLDFGDDQLRLLGGEDQSVSLKHDQSSFSVHFVTPHFFSRRPLHYAYRINGSRWISNGPSTSVNLNQLETGEILFETKAFLQEIDEDNSLSELRIEIQPPWWKSGLFRALSLLVLVLLVMYFIRQRILRIRRKAETETRIAELQMKALQAQMNPHFVFNCLNTVDGYIATNERAKASAFLAAFSKLIRKALQHSREETISLSQELRFVKNYVELEAQRLEKPFKVFWELDNEQRLREIKVPPLFVQPFVENAIKHGVVAMGDLGQLSIRTNKIGQVLELLVEDNGKGYNSTKVENPKTSLGTTITTERLQLINQKLGTSYTIDIGSNPAEKKGTRVTMSFPGS